jgi:hypothetical protein
MGTPVDPEGALALRQTQFLQWAQPIAQDWFTRLGCAARQGQVEWLRQIQSVEEECANTREHCPVQEDLDAANIECAATELLKMIENYYKEHCKLARTSDEKISLMCICRNILQAVLPPGLTKWDMSCVNSDFMKELMVLSLRILPFIKCLKVKTEAFSTCSWLLLNNIRLLRELQEFIFPTGCSRQILAELGTYWPRIKILDISSSTNVDEGSVVHLLKLKNLVYLNIDGTSITPQSYGTILSVLPDVENISWSAPADDVLMCVTKDILSSVKSITGTIQNAQILVQKCPFIKKLSVSNAVDDLSDLKNLTALTDLKIVNCDFHTINLLSILILIGPHLKRLELSFVSGVSVYALTHHCDFLETLEIANCNINHSENPLYFCEFLHFQCLACLTLIGNGCILNFNNYLACYVNLTSFTATYTAQLDDTAVSFILTNEGFQELKVFSAHHCGPLSIKSAVMLIEKCRNLSQLRGVGTWSGINKEEDMPNLLPIALKANVHITED